MHASVAFVSGVLACWWLHLIRLLVCLWAERSIGPMFLSGVLFILAGARCRSRFVDRVVGPMGLVVSGLALVNLIENVGPGGSWGRVLGFSVVCCGLRGHSALPCLVFRRGVLWHCNIVLCALWLCLVF